MNMLSYLFVVALIIKCTLGSLTEFPIISNETEQNTEMPFTEEPASVTTEKLNAVSEAAVYEDGDESAILKAIRDFLFQARDEVLESTLAITDVPLNVKTEHFLRAIEQGIIEATTIMTLEENQPSTWNFEQEAISENSDFKPEPVLIRDSPNDRIGINFLGAQSKRQTAMNLVANMTTSCSNCFDDLNTCVQRCFEKHNCNDVQRKVRVCPAVPSRLCNPFTPWSPVDECSINEDCQSPLLCCNDGCVNKCVTGEWRI